MAVAVSPAPARRYRHYDLVLAGFVTVLLCSNLIGTAKVSEIALPFALPLVGATLVFGVGNIFFPISYIFGDVLTEVYGYARARRVIWAGFLAMLFATVMSLVVIGLPPTPSEPFNATLQPALEVVFGNTWRIVLASIVGFWAGDFVNAYVLARMKVWTRGRWLWTRTIGSTIVGQAVDSVIFYPIAFLGIWQGETLVRTIAFNWSFKVLIEVVLTPVTYAVVGWLKRREHEDYYDVGTDFTPFSLKD
ncbi:MAG TPA: queuosine precursor transporter [Gammaproteobacteria bacterium]|nr:queuosine precursor transporter [Gammaproteobacteria bacterium]